MKKIQVIEHELTGSAPIRELEIGAAEAGKIITLMRGSMYSNKWGSFIREVISNAYDANKEAGYVGPVEIELPSLLSSELVIRDHGLGMTEYFMDNKYTKVGFSTKESDNNQIGGFGLGRLTPLLISDHYKIETNVDGVKYIYTMAVGKRDGLVKEYEGQSKEPNGTAIRVPCEVRDNIKIKAALEEWCRFMEPRPLVDGRPLDVDDPREPYPGFEDKPWWKNKEKQLIVLNDWVPYVVDKQHTPLEWQSNGGMGGAVIKFLPGELNITAPREALEYTGQTIKALEGKANEIINSLKEKAQEHINARAQTLLDALNMCWDYPNPIKVNLMWKNFRLNSTKLSANDIGAKKFYYKSKTLYCKKTKVYDDLIRQRHVYIDDGCKKVKERIKYSLTDEEATVFVLPPESLKNPIVMEMNWPPLSSLSEPPREEITKTPKENTNGQVIRTNKKQIKGYIWDSYYTRIASNLLKYTQECTIPTDMEGGVCLIVKNGAITKGYRTPLPDREIINDLLDFLSLNGKDLYLIPESSFPLLQGQWRLLDKVVLEKLGDKLEHYQEVYKGRFSLAHHPTKSGKVNTKLGINYLYRVSEKVFMLEKEGPILDPSGLMYKYLQESLRIKSHLETEYQEVWASNLIKPQSLGEYTKLTKLLAQVEEKYPLLKDLQLGCSDPIDVINYIRGIDLLTKESK